VQCATIWTAAGCVARRSLRTKATRAINLCIVSYLLFVPDVYLRSIEPLVAIILGCVGERRTSS
jgi:hypothetical protein